MSNLINKVKDALHSDKNDPSSTTHGTHNSDALKKADPRFDSDRDNRALHSTGQHSTGTSGLTSGQHGTTTSGLTSGQHGTTSSGLSSGHHGTTSSGLTSGQYGTTTSGLGSDQYSGSTNAGPHSSNITNKLDPRVDSDRDNRNDPTSRVGGYGTQDNYGVQGSNPTPSSGGYGTTTTTGSTYGGGSTGLSSTHHSGSTNAGPHSSNFANKVDPRVDSDRDNRNDPTSRVGGYGTQEGYGLQGSNPAPSSGGYSATGGTHTSHGHSGTGAYDQTTSGYGNTTGSSGLGHSTGGPGGYSSATPGSGNADKTAGPHNSNLLNKLDPRVDSDADGSKTYGGQKTYQ